MRYLAIFILLVLCKFSSAQSKPFILGHIAELKSKILDEQRTLNIYLPEGYDPKDNTRYPVIYLLDGSADEDFIHVVGMVQFNSFEWVNRTPKSIVVGIATVDRRRDFTFPSTSAGDKKNNPTSGGSEKFIQFLENELQPFINSNYKVTSHKTLIGQSLGGLLVSEILLNKPKLFSKYVIISPSLWWDNGSLLNRDWATLNGKFPDTVSVYLGVGKEGLTPSTPARVMEVDANLLAEKLKNIKGLKVHFDYLPEEDHATIMQQALANAFKQIWKGGE